MHYSPPRPAAFGLLLLGLLAIAPASGATSVADVVKAFCLSAYQADLKKQGKSVSLTQIDRTCGCVGERVAEGSDVEDAHDACGRPPDLRSVRKPSPQPGPDALN